MTARQRSREMTFGKWEPLPAGSLVRVISAKDPWLRRYSGMRARVGQDDGLVVEVLLSCGHLMSFWRNEVEPVAPTSQDWAYQGPDAVEPPEPPGEHGAVPGPLLQAERHRAGLTQAAIATVMGVSVPRISQIEAAPTVLAVTATRYLEALRIASLSAA
jgi:DNA-binding XRE family transcriptional regulator